MPFGPSAPRATHAEITKRVTEIVPLVLAGMRHNEIVQLATRPESEDGLGWELQPRQIRKYIAKASAEIERMASTERKKVLAHARARLDYLYGKMVAEKDYRGALAAQREVNQIYGFVSSKPEFHVAQSVNNTAVAAAAASSGEAHSVLDSVARKILDIKRRQTLEVVPQLPPGAEIEEQSA